MGGCQTAEHSKLVNEILLTFGARADVTLWKNATGAVKIGERFLRFGMKGSPDILGVMDGGIFVGIEVKTGKGRQSPEQKLFEAMIGRRGGIYVVAHSLRDVEIVLDSVTNHNDEPPHLAS